MLYKLFGTKITLTHNEVSNIKTIKEKRIKARKEHAIFIEVQ